MTNPNEKENRWQLQVLLNHFVIIVQNASNVKGTKQQATATHNQNLVQIPKHSSNRSPVQNSTPNWFVKYVNIWATLQKTADIGDPAYLHSGACLTASKPQLKTEETFGAPNRLPIG